MLELEKQNEIRGILKISPLLLLNDVLTNPEILEFCNNILPFSVGVEIEATYEILPILDTLYLLHFSESQHEQRFRIPNGYKGLLALELITNQLKCYLEKTLSGNHYHIDCSSEYKTVSEAILKSDIIEQLESWNYLGSYNTKEARRSKGAWVSLRENLQTCEVRIGELAYNYPDIYNRITHLNKIIMEIRVDNNISTHITYDNDFSIEDISTAINKSIQTITKDKEEKIRQMRINAKLIEKERKPLNKIERIIKCY